MKPFYFLEDLIKQLEGFNVDTVELELRVGGNGIVGDGDSVIRFSVNLPEYKPKKSLKDIGAML